MKTYVPHHKIQHLYPLIAPKERLLAWKDVKGMWKKRKLNPIKELEKIRKEWERKLPSLH